MKNKTIAPLLAGFLQLIAAILNPGMLLLPLRLAPHSMSSVSWNGRNQPRQKNLLSK
jgi:hypothetical protein